jgi:hypothetical protein
MSTQQGQIFVWTFFYDWSQIESIEIYVKLSNDLSFHNQLGGSWLSSLNIWHRYV